MAEVKELLEKTNQRITFFLEELRSGRDFDMSDFDTLVSNIQSSIAEMGAEKAQKYTGEMEQLVAKLDLLQKGLLEKRATVKGEIESINRQLSANMAYRKTDTQQ